MKKYLLKLLDRNHNKKLDWHEVIFPTPDINKNEKVDWWEVVVGAVCIVVFWGTILCGIFLVHHLIGG